MSRIIHLLSSLVMFFGCSQSQPSFSVFSESTTATPTNHTYPEMPLPDFLETLLSNHLPTIKSIENQAFTKFCEANGLAAEDSLNQSNYFRIQFLHDLFTSAGAYDCNRGGILKLPYFWHWVTPNPRYEIEYLAGESPQNLTKVKPPSGFQRYKSMADIDRTPSLYLSDMITETPNYRHPDCGDFYTFGWCSEREMAFAALLNMAEIESKVVVKGNHSWTESLVKMTDLDGGKTWLVVKVDNTFDSVTFSSFEGNLEVWSKDLGNTKTDRWYNEMAKSKEELEKIGNLVVGVAVTGRIESDVLSFYIGEQ